MMAFDIDTFDMKLSKHRGNLLLYLSNSNDSLISFI